MGPRPKCYECANFETEWKCKAFKKIPKEIILGFDHTKPYNNDNGIRFKKQEKAKSV